jgi:putative transposase
MGLLSFKQTYRRNLPHIQPPGATIFITFRLAGSLPREKMQELIDEANRIECQLEQIQDKKARAKNADRENRRLFGMWDALLDAGSTGPQWLANAQVAGQVSESLKYRDGEVYDLDTFCIMSNHVHAIITPLAREDQTYHSLPAIMQSLKGYTARQANKILGREGYFWQHESYDHVVRDPAELNRIRRYVLSNPVKAGLVDEWQEWPWSYCKLPIDSLL